MPDSGTQSEYWDPDHNDLSAAGVTVAEFQTEEECNFAAYLLAEAGVRSAVTVPERRLDLRLPQVRVAPDDAALAPRSRLPGALDVDHPRSSLSVVPVEMHGDVISAGRVGARFWKERTADGMHARNEKRRLPVAAQW